MLKQQCYQDHELQQLRRSESPNDLFGDYGRAKGSKEQILAESTEDDPDVIPSKLERHPDIFQANYSGKPERIKEIRPDHCQLTREDNDLDYNTNATTSSSATSILHEKKLFLIPNGFASQEHNQLLQPEVISPTRPSTLPVHRTHDIYTRSLRVQESCI